MIFLILYTLILFLVAFLLGAAIGGAVRSLRAYFLSDWKELSLDKSELAVAGVPVGAAAFVETPVEVSQEVVEPVRIIAEESDAAAEQEWAEVSRADDSIAEPEDVAEDVMVTPLETSELPEKEALSSAEVNLATADEPVEQVQDFASQQPLETGEVEIAPTPVQEVQKEDVDDAGAEVFDADEIGHGLVADDPTESDVEVEEPVEADEAGVLDHDEIGYAFVSDGPAQDLTQIKGIDEDMAGRLSAIGVERFEQIANLTAGETAFLSKSLGLTSEINEQCWIEQAKILADGGSTAFVSEAVSDVDISEPVIEDVADSYEDLAAAETFEEETAEQESSIDDAEEEAAHINTDEVASEIQESVSEVVSEDAEDIGAVERPVDSDDLKQITHISTGLEKKLNLLGVYKLSQIANWTEDDIERISEQLEIKDQIKSEDWMTEAQLILEDAEANMDESDAARLVGDITPLEPAPSGEANDLRRIRGIDADAERVLHELNVMTYAQIADWDQGKIDQVNEALGTTGRVERQYWIVQAKVLRDGGDTEFSRLYDDS